MFLDYRNVGKRRSYSANHFAPIELNNSSTKDSDNYSEYNLAISSKTMPLKKFQEDDIH